MQHRGVEKLQRSKVKVEWIERKLEEQKKGEKKKKKQTSTLGFISFSSGTMKVLNTHLLSFVLLFTFFLLFFSSFFFFFSRCILGAMWVWSPEKLMREGCILYYHIILGRSQLLFYSSLFYFFFRIFIISIYSSDWKWMWRLKRTNHGLSWFFIPGGEEEEDEDEDRVLLFGLSGSSLPQRHYCLGERTSVAFQKSYVRVRNVWVSVCVRERAKEREGSAKMSDVWILDSIFFEKCSYFSSLGFLWYR